MAARFKKRPSKIENKVLKLDTLKLCDLLCSICHSIIVEPVTLPCFHDFCRVCFNGTIENNSLSCPLCRMRIGSWLRTATKQNSLVNVKLWNFVKLRFSQEIADKLQGKDLNLPQEKCLYHLSAPGEIRSEYEAEIERHRKERRLLEEKTAEQTKVLIKDLEEQERREQQAKLKEQLLRDEILAKQILLQEDGTKRNRMANSSSGGSTAPLASEASARFYRQIAADKPKRGTLDKFILKASTTINEESPLITDDSSGSVASCATSAKTASPAACDNSPELTSTAGRYNRFLRDYLDRKFRFFSGNSSDKSMEHVRKPAITKHLPKTWEPGGCIRNSSKPVQLNDQKEFCTNINAPRSSNTTIVHSLPVSIPSSVLLRRQVVMKGGAETSGASTKISLALEEVASSSFSSRLRGLDTDSEDSLKQELCYFKPVHSVTQSSRLINSNPTKVLRIPAVRPSSADLHQPTKHPVLDCSEYLQGLYQLRAACEDPASDSSAFVCLIKMAHNQQDMISKKWKQSTSGKKCFKGSKAKQDTSPITDKANTDHENNNCIDKSGASDKIHIDNFENLHISPRKPTHRRRMLKNEPSESVQPSKSDKVRTLRSYMNTNDKACSDTALKTKQSTVKKRVSFTQKENAKDDVRLYDGMLHPSEHSKVKHLNGETKRGISRLKSVEMDVMDGLLSDPSLVEEQRRLEEKLAQEKHDLELALRIQKEWAQGVNRGGYSLRANASKRQVSLLDMMHGAKKMKV